MNVSESHRKAMCRKGLIYLRLAISMLSGLVLATDVVVAQKTNDYRPKPPVLHPGLDLRDAMRLAAQAIPPRLDPQKNYRPWFLLHGSNNIPVSAEHSMWDVGDMSGRYLESLILSRRMGISSPELAQAEWRLAQYLYKSIGPDGLIHDPESGAVDNSFSQGSALYGLLAWYEDTGDPKVRAATERLITALLNRAERHGNQLIDPTYKVPNCSASHLVGYEIFPVIRFYELTGSTNALTLAEGLTAWAMADPILGENGEIKSTDSWAGHIHSWLDTLAGCVRTARNSTSLNRSQIIAKSKAVYDWTRKSNMTSFGWIATFPTHGSSETCAISSAIRLALELSACGDTEYLEDVERFVRNQVVEAQFKNLDAYKTGTNRATPLLIGCFDSQSLPNGHLGTRGGEDVGNVEGCCLNGGMRALALAWDAIQTCDERGVTVQLALDRSGPGAEVIAYQPFEGRVDVTPRAPGAVRVRVPSWAKRENVSVLVDSKRTACTFENNFAVVASVAAGKRVSVRYPLRQLKEDVVAGGQTYHVQWKGDVVVGMNPPGPREPTYQNRLSPRSTAIQHANVPNSYPLHDAVRLASASMLARLDLARGGQPFFRIYPFANPPRAEHEKWDDGDMSGRYIEALIAARRMTGTPIDTRELTLRTYFASLFNPADGLCYTKQTEWTPHTVDIFSQSSAMLGLLAWWKETGSPEARGLLDRQVDGLMRIAVQRNGTFYFPKYEYDGKVYTDDPPDQAAPIWYGGRLIVPLTEYWKISHRDDVRQFTEGLARYVIESSGAVKTNGEMTGIGWWGHLHATMDMVAGITEFARVTDHPEWIEWSHKVFDWIGRTHTTRPGWVADSCGSSTCESCAIASRIRLALALYRAGAIDPFDEIDRDLRNQLLQNQFNDLSFLPALKTTTPRTDRAVYDGIDRMIRGTFQCWGGVNDLLGNDDIEGCGAGGGVQGIALAWDARSEWRTSPKGTELRINLLFNQRIRAPAEAPFETAAPIAAELWSYLPNEGKVVLKANQPIRRIVMRIPTGADYTHVWLQRGLVKRTIIKKVIRNKYITIVKVAAGETIEIHFPLREYETIERAARHDYEVTWKGNAVASISPEGKKFPLYQHTGDALKKTTPLGAPRYP